MTMLNTSNRDGGYDLPTDPPDDRGYCPYCYADMEEAHCVDDLEYTCGGCGRTVYNANAHHHPHPISHAQMLHEARQEAGYAKADEEREARDDG